MPLDPRYLDVSLAPTAPYQVSREKIREFADAIGACDAIHRDPAAAGRLGYPEVVAPATFAIVVAQATFQQLVDERELGFDVRRSVHAEQRLCSARPIHAGDELVCVLTVVGITQRSTHEQLVTRTDIRTTSGELVATATATLVIRS
jgi:acyl dehydratase